MTDHTDLIVSPAVVEGVGFVEKPTGPAAPPPMPKPDPTHTRLSALVLLGALAVASVGVHRQPDGLEVASGAVFAALVLFLTCLARFNVAAQAAQ